MNPDRLAELEEERRFLLRSLRDLDAERAAGDVEDADYDTLRDGYTKRAATVLRQIDDGRSALPRRPDRRWGRRAAVVGIVVAVAIGAGWLVARSSGQRLDGQEITGGALSDDVAVQLAEARRLLAADPAVAQELYGRVLEVRPDQPEALTYLAWLLFRGSFAAPTELRKVAVETAREQLGRAVAADGTYPDPHCFLAVIAADTSTTETPDVATARREADQCLGLDPPAQVRALVEGFLADLPTSPSSTAPS